MRIGMGAEPPRVREQAIRCELRQLALRKTPAVRLNQELLCLTPTAPAPTPEPAHSFELLGGHTLPFRRHRRAKLPPTRRAVLGHPVLARDPGHLGKSVPGDRPDPLAIPIGVH
jgi:hypothetical protein